MKHQYHNIVDYYKSLDKKAPFLRAVARRCGVSIYTVKTWCYGDGKTKNEEYIKILSEESNIDADKLWSYGN